MRLSCRSAYYKHQPTLICAENAEVIDCSVGQHTEFAYPRHISAPQPLMRLQPGSASPGAIGEGIGKENAEAAAQANAASTLKQIGLHAAIVDSSKHQANELTKVHRQNIERRLYHRIQVASALGNEELLHQLNGEMQRLG